MKSDNCATDPCTERHCRVCERRHVTVDGHGADLTCAPCLALVRDHLHAIVRLAAALRTEVTHVGVDSEAMALLGPAADPDQWDARVTLAVAGKVVLADCDAHDLDELRTWIDETTASNLHPLSVLGTWDLMWRDTLGHARTADDTLAGAAAYLNEHLTRMAHFEHLDFKPFAFALHACRRNLERVLHDGEQVERGAPCWHCGAAMVREYGTKPSLDGWRCPRISCAFEVTELQYRGWVELDALEHAEALTATDLERRFGVPAARVRVWGSRHPELKVGRNHDGLTLYSVAAISARHESRPA